jgi:hypothetical protein
MSIIASLLFATVVAGQADDARSWIKPLDYPAAALRASRGGVTGFALTFSEKGEPIRCDIGYSSGWDDLDQATCKLLMKRGKMKPALGSDGRPVLYVYRSTHRWFIEGMEQPRPNPPRHDLEQKMERLPAGITAPAVVEVAFQVDADGVISDCSATKPGNPAGRRFAETQRASAALWAEACRVVGAQARPAPALDSAGKPAASVQTLRVQFTTGQ